MTQEELVFEYYRARPDREIPHAEVVDWATAEYQRRYGQDAILRDPDRAIRKLAQEGRLVKVSKGVYKYVGEHTRLRVLYDFDERTKYVILQRDGFRCVVCGKGRADGVALHVDHRVPKDQGGEATVDNGQTLCAAHNFQKKNYGCTEFGHRLFERWRDAAMRVGDSELESFCEEVLSVFRRHRRL